jgi:hypothetical protein
MIFNLLLGNPYPWLFASALFAGGALSSLTRRAVRARDPEKARERKGFFAAAAVTLCVVFLLCAVFVPGPEKIRDLAVIPFYLVVTAVFFLAFRFKKAAGLPVLILAGGLAVALFLFFQAVVSFTGETEVARIRVTSTAGNAMKFDLIGEDGKSESLEMPGTLLGAEVKEIIFHDVFVFLGAKTAYRFTGLKSARVPPGSEMTQELRAHEFKRPAGISESLYRFVESNPSLIPGVKTVQVQITYAAVKPNTDYSLRVQHDSGMEIMKVTLDAK